MLKSGIFFLLFPSPTKNQCLQKSCFLYKTFYLIKYRKSSLTNINIETFEIKAHLQAFILHSCLQENLSHYKKTEHMKTN